MGVLLVSCGPVDGLVAVDAVHAVVLDGGEGVE
jgi:hypothetical protein